MIAAIRRTFLRRSVVVLTVIALVAMMLPLWIINAIWARIRDEFGEDIVAAWRGKSV